ncbi:MAG TPA: plastocyanin/azurin family copper-binding protein [Gemmatimonadaceae bacterium]|nr:plastocyanin/azurin family copper-binding protein [Gemmatimonadaceae bacterium]
MRMWRLSLAAIGIVLVAACGGGSSDTTTTGPGNNTPPGGGNNNNNPNTVTLVDSSFNPANITVKAGQTVTWQWSSCTDTTGGYGGGYPCVTHQIQFDDGSGVVSPKQDQGTFNRTFSGTGTFKYHCLIHGSYMSGQVVVQ